MPDPAPKTAQALMDEAVAAPTLDECLRRDPSDLTSEDRDRIIELERGERARFITSRDKRAEKKEGVTTDE